MRVRFPHTARYDSMPVGSSRRGSHDHAGRVRWSASPFVRRTRGPSPAPIILWVDDANSPPSEGVGANPIKPIRPVRERFPGTRATAFLVSRPTGCGNGLGGAWASQPVIPVMPHAVVRASTAGMGAGIRHEWPDRLWTVRILRPRKGGIRACFRGPTGRGDSPRNCPVRVRIPAKAPAEATASTPPDPVRTSAGTGTMPR